MDQSSFSLPVYEVVRFLCLMCDSRCLVDTFVVHGDVIPGALTSSNDMEWTSISWSCDFP
jgi:hypothetical protein